MQEVTCAMRQGEHFSSAASRRQTETALANHFQSVPRSGSDLCTPLGRLSTSPYCLVMREAILVTRNNAGAGLCVVCCVRAAWDELDRDPHTA